MQSRLGSGTFSSRGSVPADRNRLDVLWREIAIELLGLVVEGCGRGLRLVDWNRCLQESVLSEPLVLWCSVDR